MNTGYEKDLRWIVAREVLLSRPLELSASEVKDRRRQAVQQMFEIETEYETA